MPCKLPNMCRGGTGAFVRSKADTERCVREQWEQSSIDALSGAWCTKC